MELGQRRGGPGRQRPSDLLPAGTRGEAGEEPGPPGPERWRAEDGGPPGAAPPDRRRGGSAGWAESAEGEGGRRARRAFRPRSEERRVGKEGRSRWAPDP